jgi:hypothetical protein
MQQSSSLAKCAGEWPRSARDFIVASGAADRLGFSSETVTDASRPEWPECAEDEGATSPIDPRLVRPVIGEPAEHPPALPGQAGASELDHPRLELGPGQDGWWHRSYPTRVLMEKLTLVGYDQCHQPNSIELCSACPLPFIPRS